MAPAEGVSALYVQPDGVYPQLVADYWDLARDAKRYEGPNPVVAHPPCGPWGKMHGLCTRQDPTCGPRAFEQVRRWGGVLEHPEHSRLFRHCRAPRPGEQPDEWGGYTVAVQQVSWGHPCVKPTWLYCVGINSNVVLAGTRTGGVPTHRITSGPRGPQLPSASKKVASATPPEFAKWLVSLASQTSPREET